MGAAGGAGLVGLAALAVRRHAAPALQRTRAGAVFVSAGQQRLQSTGTQQKRSSNAVVDVFKSFVVQPAMAIINGVKILGGNTRVMVRIWLQIQGKQRTKTSKRSEVLLVQRTRRDLKVFFPFIIYCMMPFTLPTIPVILKFFPGLVPSTFITEEAWIQQSLFVERRRVRAAAQVADEVRKAAERVLEAHARGDKGATAEDAYAARQWLQLSSSQTPPPFSSLLPLRPLFLRHFNLFTPPSSATAPLCRLLNLPFEALLPASVNRARLARWAGWTDADDGMLLEQEGVGGTGEGGRGLGDDEVVKAAQDRGFTPVLDILLSRGVDPLKPPQSLFPLTAAERRAALAHLSEHARLRAAYRQRHADQVRLGVAEGVAGEGDAALEGSVRGKVEYLRAREMGAWAGMVAAGRALEARGKAAAMQVKASRPAGAA